MISSTINEWHQIVAEKNIVKLEKLLDENVVFHSPVVHTPQQGKKITLLYLKAAFEVFFDDSFSYIKEIEGDQYAVLELSLIHI